MRVLHHSAYVKVAEALSIIAVPVAIVVLWAVVDWVASRNCEKSSVGSVGSLRNDFARLTSGLCLLGFGATFFVGAYYLFTKGFTAADNIAIALNSAWYAGFAIAAAIQFWNANDKNPDLNLTTLQAKLMLCSFICKITSMGAFVLSLPDHALTPALAMTSLAVICVFVVIRSPFRVTENISATIVA